MDTDIQRLLNTFGELRKEANVDACFGEPVQVEGRTVIPIARVAYGLGVGAGQAPMEEGEEGGGAGGGSGLMSSPLGVVEVTSRGMRVEPVVDRQKVSIVALLVGAWVAFWIARALIAIFRREE